MKKKTASYTRVALSQLFAAIKKRFKLSIAPYGYGDELHVFEGLSPVKKMGAYSIKQILLDKDAASQALEPFETARHTSSSDVQWLLSLALAAGLLEGKNFIVDMQQ